MGQINAKWILNGPSEPNRTQRTQLQLSGSNYVMVDQLHPSETHLIYSSMFTVGATVFNTHTHSNNALPQERDHRHCKGLLTVRFRNHALLLKRLLSEA